MSTLEPVRTNPPYLYWAEVYRIPLTPNVPGTYQLREYIVKNSYPVSRYSTSGTTYSRYFGSANSESAGSFVTVQHDGFGNLRFEFNTVSTLSGDSSANTTLKGLMYASYYYANSQYRLTNLEARRSDGTTKLIGMNKSGVVTSIVSIPNQSLVDYLEPSTNDYGSGDSGGGGYPGDPSDDGFGDTEGSGNNGGDDGPGDGSSGDGSSGDGSSGDGS